MKITPYLDESYSRWEQTLYAFLAEKHQLSGSFRTVGSYSRMLQNFFGMTGKTPDGVSSQDVFAWAYGAGLSGRQPSASTISSRIACLSSFYRFLIRMQVLTSNPCDAIERPRINPSVPRGLSAEQIRRLLEGLPTTPVGLRDRAIILTLVLTGQRRQEILGLTAGNISIEDPVMYTYRGKGGKTGRRELPRPAFDAIQVWLAAVGKSLTTMMPTESLWPDIRHGRGITSGTFYANLRRYLQKAGLPPAGVHILRHSAAKLRRDAGESIEDVSRFLDHSSLAVTTTLLAPPRGPGRQGLDEGRRSTRRLATGCHLDSHGAAVAGAGERCRTPCRKPCRLPSGRGLPRGLKQDCYKARVVFSTSQTGRRMFRIERSSADWMAVHGHPPRAKRRTAFDPRFPSGSPALTAWSTVSSLVR